MPIQAGNAIERRIYYLMFPKRRRHTTLGRAMGKYQVWSGREAGSRENLRPKP
jgi:hypothetical protein